MRTDHAAPSVRHASPATSPWHTPCSIYSMKTMKLQCKLTYSDGVSVSGEILCHDTIGESAVNYHGMVERLPHRIGIATLAALRAQFRAFAFQTGAVYSERCEEVEPATGPDAGSPPPP